MNRMGVIVVEIEEKITLKGAQYLKTVKVRRDSETAAYLMHFGWLKRTCELRRNRGAVRITTGTTLQTSSGTVRNVFPNGVEIFGRKKPSFHLNNDHRRAVKVRR